MQVEGYAHLSRLFHSSAWNTVNWTRFCDLERSIWRILAQTTILISVVLFVASCAILHTFRSKISSFYRAYPAKALPIASFSVEVYYLFFYRALWHHRVTRSTSPSVFQDIFGISETN